MSNTLNTYNVKNIEAISSIVKQLQSNFHAAPAGTFITDAVVDLIDLQFDFADKGVAAYIETRVGYRRGTGDYLHAHHVTGQVIGKLQRVETDLYGRYVEGDSIRKTNKEINRVIDDLTKLRDYVIENPDDELVDGLFNHMFK